MSSPVTALSWLDEHCEWIARPDGINFALSLLIVIGILVSYLPQHIRIIRRASSEGLSPWFVLLGTVSGTCALFNVFILPDSAADITCCKRNSAFSCFAGLLGIAQVSVQWLCFFAIMLLFLIYFPRDASTEIDLSLDHDDTKPQYRDALTVAGISFAHLFILIIFSIIFYALDLWVGWAVFLGVTATLLACVQYIPQIYTTYKLGEVKSLSIPMMCIQTPGSYIFAMSLFMRWGWRGWSVWGTYVVTGALQGILLGMGIQFTLRDRKRSKALEEETRRNTEYNGHRNARDDNEDGEPDEQTPLLEDRAE